VHRRSVSPTTIFVKHICVVGADPSSGLLLVGFALVLAVIVRAVASVGICLFEVPPDAEEPFLAAWDRAPASAVLHRALRPDVDFRFVVVGPAGGRAILPFPAHLGQYEVVREHGAPDTSGGVLLIDAVEVPDGDDERFLDEWDVARETLAGQQGYLGTRLHRSIGRADFRFVDIVRWSSPLMYARALKRPDFRRAARAAPFTPHSALYQPVRG
jgi:heme oxygenase (mycobilin-producing)